MADQFPPDLPSQFPPDEEDLGQPREERPPRGTRGAVLLGARILTGVVGCGIAVVVLAATALVPLPRLAASAPSTVVTPIAADQLKLCAGPLLRLGDDSGQDATVASSFGSPTVRSGAEHGSVITGRLKQTDNSSGVAPTVLTLPSEDAGADFAGSQVQLAAGGDVAGLAAAGCADGSGDAWLVGGSTETGRTTLITLGNPTEVTSTVSLEIFTENGRVIAAGTDGITVPAGSQRVVSLAAFAPGAASPVVHVVSRGGLIVANLQQTVVRTLRPGGADIVSVTSAPAERSVIPGVVIADAKGIATTAASPGFEDVVPVLRLYAPGGEAVDARIQAIPEDGKSTGSSATVSVPAGEVAEFSLSAFADGDYSLVVTGDAPLVGAVRLPSLGASGQVDLAWIPAARTLDDHAMIVAAPGPAAELHLVNPGAAAVEATLTPADGSAAGRKLSLPAGTAVAVPLGAASGYRLTGGAGLLGSVVYTGDGEIAGFPVAPPAQVSRPIRVYPG